MTIHGTNLSDAIAVSFGWREGQILDVHPPSSLTVLSPPISDGAWEHVDITVTNTSGTSELNDAARFTYTEAGEDEESLPFPGKLLNSLIGKALKVVGLGPAGTGCAQR